MKDTNEHMEIITGSGSIDPLKPYVTPEFQATSNVHQSKLNENSFLRDTQKQSFAVTLDQASIATDQTIEGYWNERCAEKQLDWWLPKVSVADPDRIGSQGQASRSSGDAKASSGSPKATLGLLNYQEEKSAFWKKR